MHGFASYAEPGDVRPGSHVPDTGTTPSPKLEPTAGISATARTAARNGNAKEVPLSALITRELPKLYSLALALARDNDHANDLVQDTVERILTYAHQWQPGTNFAAWASVILRNRFYTDCLRKSRARKIMVQESACHEAIAPSQEKNVACREIMAAINRLPRSQRTAVKLAVFSGLSSEGIAAKMGISPNAVRCQLLRARKQLRDADGVLESLPVTPVPSACGD